MGCKLMRSGLLLGLCFLLMEAESFCAPVPWPLWNAYAARFVDTQGRVIDHQAGDRTTSEGQAYALFFALVDNDRPRFERILAWTQDNMSSGNLAQRLPGWLWGKADDGQWKPLDINPAADADCWIAYTLLEAGRLWGDAGYGKLGHAVLAQIAKEEVGELPGFGIMLLPGPGAAFQHGQTWTVNPSYLPLFLFERFAGTDPGGPWKAIAASIPRLLAQSSRGKFAMDWVDYTPGKGFVPASGPNPLKPGEKQPDPVGSYDAIRVYMWAGMLAPSDPAKGHVLQAVSGMATYLGEHGSPLEKVSEQGTPLAQDGPIGFSAGVLPYLRGIPGTEKAFARQKARLQTQLDPTTGLYGKSPAYYDQNLVLFATGFLDGRYHFGPQGELKVRWKRG